MTVKEIIEQIEDLEKQAREHHNTATGLEHDAEQLRKRLYPMFDPTNDKAKRFETCYFYVGKIRYAISKNDGRVSIYQQNCITDVSDTEVPEQQ